MPAVCGTVCAAIVAGSLKLSCSRMSLSTLQGMGLDYYEETMLSPTGASMWTSVLLGGRALLSMWEALGLVSRSSVGSFPGFVGSRNMLVPS